MSGKRSDIMFQLFLKAADTLQYTDKTVFLIPKIMLWEKYLVGWLIKFFHVK